MVIAALLSGQQGALLIEAVLSGHNHVIIAATLPALQENSSNGILFNIHLPLKHKTLLKDMLIFLRISDFF